MTKSRITAVNFTYAMPDGMWTDRFGGSRNWESFDTLRAELGGDEVERLRLVAMANGMSGMWYDVDRDPCSVCKDDDQYCGLCQRKPKLDPTANGTQISSGKRIVVGERHTDYAVPMNAVTFADGHTGILKDCEINRD